MGRALLRTRHVRLPLEPEWFWTFRRNTAEAISHKCREDPEFPRIAGSHISIQRLSSHRKVNLNFLSLLTSLVCVPVAFGQTNTSYYVSTTGNDSNPGTQAAPWRTIQHAADTARAGSTVNVRGGIYEELVSINVSGNAADGFITFRSYPGEAAILDAARLTPSGRVG